MPIHASCIVLRRPSISSSEASKLSARCRRCASSKPSCTRLRAPATAFTCWAISRKLWVSSSNIRSTRARWPRAERTLCTRSVGAGVGCGSQSYVFLPAHRRLWQFGAPVHRLQRSLYLPDRRLVAQVRLGIQIAGALLQAWPKM
jgi:hypothetical protein